MASYVEIIRLFLSSQTLDFRKNTPAYAGNTSDPSSTIPVFRDHPRLRGEYDRLPVPLIVPVGSPPLARGIPQLPSVVAVCPGSTPACAGNTGMCIRIGSVGRDHPRLRGEYYTASVCSDGIRGSPPLARGIQPLSISDGEAIGITPACAGNTCGSSSLCPCHEDHPRLRGEYHRIHKYDLQHVGSPPLARGIRIVEFMTQVLKGITPACAGNTNI